jgi:hypothetical protein
MKPTTKSLRKHQKTARKLIAVALGHAVAGAAGLLQAQIANTPPTGPENNGTLNNQLGVSGDYLVGYGKLSVPFGYSLARVVSNVPIKVSQGSRDSTYYGGTVSYSFTPAWFLDFSFSQGA